MQYADSTFVLDILDMIPKSSQGELASLHEGHFQERGATALVYSITDRRSFEDIPLYLEEIKTRFAKSHPLLQRLPVVLVGNKRDMAAEERQVSALEGVQFAQAHGIPFLETRYSCDFF